MKISLLFFLTAFSIPAFAQQTVETKPEKDFEPPILVRGVGISFQKFDGLNSRLANRPEYKTLRDAAGTLSLGMMRMHGGFISDIQLEGGSSMSGDRNKRSSTIRYVALGIDLGYDVIPAERILLYPLLGIGFQGYMARFYKDNSAVPFDLVLTSSDVQNSIRPVDFTNSFFTYRLGFGFAVKPPKNTSASVGIQARYIGSFKEKSWKSNDNQALADAPADRLSQFEVSLILTNMLGKNFMK